MSDRGAVVITGASTGTGEAATVRLATSGFRVFAGLRNKALSTSIGLENG